MTRKTWVESEEMAAWIAERLPKAKRVTIVSPYITRSGLSAVIEDLRRPNRKVDLRIVTCMDPIAAASGALDLDALDSLLKSSTPVRPVAIVHVPSLHAKVLLFDETDALVGSGNLTQPGTAGGNVELGYRTNDRAEVAAVLQKVDSWVERGRTISRLDIQRHKVLVEQEYKDIRERIANANAVQTVPESTGKDEEYYQGVQNLLKTTGGKTGVSPAQVLTLLKGKASDGSKTQHARLAFLKRLQLLEERDGIVRTTELGAEVAGPKGKACLAEVLRREYRDVHRVWSIFEQNPTRKMKYEDLFNLLGVDGLESARVKQSVLWLKCLGVVTQEFDRHFKVFKLAPAHRKKMPARE